MDRDAGARNEIAYLAMEYVPGYTLRTVLQRQGRLTPRIALAYLDAIVDGLAAAHAIHNGLTAVEATHGLAMAHDDIWCTAGVHPHEAKDAADLTAATLIELAQRPKVVGIGECGLDFHYDLSPRDVQAAVFRQHVAAARETSLPLVIHTREADDVMASILREEYAAWPFKMLMHCYTSGAELVKIAAEMGAWFSVSGIATFKAAEDVRAVIFNRKATLAADGWGAITWPAGVLSRTQGPWAWTVVVPCGLRKPRPWAAKAAPAVAHREPEGVPLAYETVDWKPAQAGRLSDAIYEEYGLQTIRISGACAHPTQLVQSTSMASVAPPKPSYRPMLPADVLGLLSAYLASRVVTTVFNGQSGGSYDHYFNLFLPPADVLWSFGKVLVFAFVIILVHCYYGYYASGGPAGVGVAVGHAVRAALVLIAVLDFFLGLAIWGTTTTVRVGG